jgi:hypothetical protein
MLFLQRTIRLLPKVPVWILPQFKLFVKKKSGEIRTFESGEYIGKRQEKKSKGYQLYKVS